MKTAIITGIAGQDGSYLSKFLLNKNYKVIGIVRNSQKLNIKNLIYLGLEKDVIIEKLDLLNFHKILELLKKYKPDEVYNLAAQSSVSLSFDQPISTFTFNTLSVNNLIESIKQLNPSIKFYQAGSSDMYGNAKKLPITLETKMQPISPYAISKVSSFHMVKLYRKSFNLFFSNGILFNHESFLRKNNFFIKKVIRDSLNIKNGYLKKLIVGNLSIKRDFGYAPKYIEAMWKILQHDKANDFIICSGKSILLRDIVNYVFDKIGLDKNLIVEDKSFFRHNEIEDIYGDCTKSKIELNWDYDISFFQVIDQLIEEEIRNS